MESRVRFFPTLGPFLSSSNYFNTFNLKRRNFLFCPPSWTPFTLVVPSHSLVPGPALDSNADLAILSPTCQKLTFVRFCTQAPTRLFSETENMTPSRTLSSQLSSRRRAPRSRAAPRHRSKLAIRLRSGQSQKTQSSLRIFVLCPPRGTRTPNQPRIRRTLYH